MDLLLVIPPSPGRGNIIRMIDCSHEAKANYLWQPNDFLIISSLLRPADGVAFVDGTADALSGDQFDNKLGGLRADLLIMALSSVCWESDIAYFRRTRARFPDVPAYVLGDIFLEEGYRRYILAECDGIVMNPYQLDLQAMTARRERGGAVLPGVCTSADQPLFPDGKRVIAVSSGTPRHELFLKRRYRFPFARHYRFSTVTTMWGCPFTCTYCSDSNFPPVVRSSRDVLQELAYVDGLGIRELFFADKVFGFSRQNSEPLLEAMTRRFAFSWSCYFHPQLHDPAFLAQMKAAGCHTVIIGVDSADVPSLTRYRRHVDRSRIEQLIDDANRLKIDVCADFILGLEHETEADVVRTIEYALALPIDFASFNVAAPLPGSDIRKRMAASGMLTFGKEGFDTCGRSGVLGSGNITSDQLRGLRKRAFRRFYLRPSYLVRRLGRTGSLEHLLIQAQEMATMIRKI